MLGVGYTNRTIQEERFERAALLAFEQNRNGSTKFSPTMQQIATAAIIGPVRRDKVDLLDEWTKACHDASNPLNLRAAFPREAVEEIHRVLVSFFSSKFFLHQYGQFAALDKIHFIKRLLQRGTRPDGFNALYEACELIAYAQKHEPSLYQRLRDGIRSSTQFQATLYEALVASRLKRSGLDFSIQTDTDGTPLDGVIRHDGVTYIVECKQLSVPNPEEFDSLRLTADAVVAGLDAVHITEGYGLRLTFPRPVDGGSSEQAKTALRQFASHLQAEKGKLSQPYLLVLPKLKLEALPWGSLDRGGKTNNDQLCLVLNVGMPQPLKGETTVVPIELSAEVSYDKSTILEKLRRTISRARKQHERRSHHGLVLLLDSQEIPDFRMGLFTGTDMLTESALQSAIGRERGNAVVVITRRTYTSTGSNIEIASLNNEHQQGLANRLHRAFKPPPTLPTLLHKPTPEEIARVHFGTLNHN